MSKRRRITQADFDDARRWLDLKESVWTMANEGAIVIIAPPGISKTDVLATLSKAVLGLKIDRRIAFLLDEGQMSDEERSGAIVVKSGVDTGVVN